MGCVGEQEAEAAEASGVDKRWQCQSTMRGRGASKEEEEEAYEGWRWRRRPFLFLR